MRARFKNETNEVQIEYGCFSSLLYIFIQYFKYSVYLINNKNYDYFFLMHKAFFHGYVGNFSLLEKYLKK